MDPATAIGYLKGVGPARAKLLEGKGVSTVEDLLYYMPFRYEDRSNVKRISELAAGETATVLGTVTAKELFRSRRSRLRLFEIRVRDDSGGVLVGKWFRGDYLDGIFAMGQLVALYGKIEYDEYSRELSMMHPEYEVFRPDDPETALHLGRITPIYRAIGKITSRAIRSLVWRAVSSVELGDDPMPLDIRRRLGLPERSKALSETHFPPEKTDLRALEAFRTPAQRRLIFEEFFYLETGLALKRRKAKAAKGIAFELNDRAREKIKQVLPFKPTAAQKRVLREIALDMAEPTPMNRLLQGDVGSGKTIVAVEAAIIAVENGCQVAVMAPTEILAAQHYINFRKLLEPAGYVVVPLTGAYKRGARAKIERMIAEGVAQVVVGTHALISKGVEYRRLGLIVIDEQHRFGVIQRLELLRKGEHPDVLVMTATPYPPDALTHGLRRTRCLDHRRAAAGPHADRHAPSHLRPRREGVQLRRPPSARGPSGLCGLPACRGVRDQGRQGGRRRPMSGCLEMSSPNSGSGCFTASCRPTTKPLRWNRSRAARRRSWSPRRSSRSASTFPTPRSWSSSTPRRSA